MTDKNHRETTRIMRAGHKPEDYKGMVSAPVCRASTLVYPSLEDFLDPEFKYDYGRHITPAIENFTIAISELEQGHDAIVAPCGLSAITTALLGFLSSGDHLLVSDCIYGPVRRFCEKTLKKKFGIEITYFDPHIGAGISDLIQDNTRVVYMESPGSAIYDVSDVPAINKAAKAKNADIITMLDNTFASGVLFKPLTHGVDISLLSCTKYINGYADGMLGAAVARDEAVFKTLKQAAQNVGVSAGSEEINLAIRGLKTIHIRMKEAGARGLEMAKWLEARDDVVRVYHLALESHPAHDVFKRDYTGGNGLLSIVLKPASMEALKAFIEASELFYLGDSWGAYESLMQPQYLIPSRTAVPWEEEGYLIRLQIGFEDLEDLKADLEQCLKAYYAV